MYTVMIGDDGMFSAEYVVPPALSIPLGTSGSTVDVIRNEDGTFSANGEVITAETMVTAENGNVYAAVLSPEGVPVDVMHVAAMQDVMLGELGGTVTLTQAEDKSWWLGEMAVMDGSVHTHENGNMYTLMMDAEGMWSAMYQKVEVMVSLGSTQESVTLERAEDMSWWLGSEAVDVGSEVMSESGNTYTLWYTDGVWSTEFVPESMMIEGTGLVAMTREGDDMYDVGGATLAASGVGDVTVDGAMYHVWMQDGALMGARFDVKPQNDTRRVISVNTPALSSDDEVGLLMAMGYDTDEVKTTPANEANAYLKVRDEYFSLGTLLSTGQASRVGTGQSTIVSSALGEIRQLRAKAVAAVGALPDNDDADILENALDNIWADAQGQVDLIFGKDGSDSNVGLGNAENDDEILEDFDEVIQALEDVAAFQEATKSGGGVFKDAKLSADAAAAAFTAEQKQAMATFGAVGNTRFGAFWRKQRSDATSKLADPLSNALGAFAYATTDTMKTQRTRYVRQGTGSAFYSGETQAVDGKGNFFSGDIDIQVRFAAEQVNAVITNLKGADGGWEYLYANTDVASIALPDTKLGNAASWNSGARTGATVSYATRAGIPRPVTADYTFVGQLLGREPGDQGNEAVGTWSLGAASQGKNYLAGGFGALRGDDLPDIRPEPDGGTGATTKVLPYGDILKEGEDRHHGTDGQDNRGQTIAQGVLKVTGQQYNTADEPTAIVDDQSTDPGTNKAKFRTHEIDLAADLDVGSAKWHNGDKHVDLAKTAIEKQLVVLESDIAIPESVKIAAWGKIQDAIVNHLFGIRVVAGASGASAADARGALPETLGLTYSDKQNDDFVEAAKDVLAALESNDALIAALKVKGILYREAAAADDLGTTVNETQLGQLANPTNGKANDDPDGVKLFDRRVSRVQYMVNSTDFTRFGAWRRQTSPNAQAGYTARTESAEGDGPNALAYSQLSKTAYIDDHDPRFPAGARMVYEGGTVGVLGNVFFTGDIDVEVLWNSGSLGGMANMSISEIENVANGARLYVDTDTGANAYQSDQDKVDNALEVLVSIDINNVMINGTLELSLGEESSVMVKSVGSGAVATTASTLHARIGDGSDAAAKVMGNFVGQGVSGPLAVLGTYELNSHSDTVGIGDMMEGDTDMEDHNIGATLTVTGGGDAPVVLHGGFGAEMP